VKLGLSLAGLFPGEVGGAETYVREVLEGLVTTPDDLSLTVLARQPVIDAYSDLPLSFCKLRPIPTHDRTVRSLALLASHLSPRGARHCCRTGFDVVHYPLPVAVPKFRGPSVVTLHDVHHHDMPHLFSQARRAYRRLVFDRASRAATLVVTVSNFAKARISARLAIPPERIRVIYSGIDRESFSPTSLDGDGQHLAPFRLPRRFILYPANYWPHKNHARLLQGLAQAVDTDLGLVLTGQAYGQLDAIRHSVRRLGLADRVCHLGYLSARALPALYRRALAVVFPSLYEGFGFPPLEAMACGTPVAASRIPALKETCQEAALFFDPYDPDEIARAIDQVAQDQRLRKCLRAAGLSRSRQFSWDHTTAAHLECYHAAITRATSQR
jgi:glycosyltransferase involved in cell wall biosynthesis